MFLLHQLLGLCQDGRQEVRDGAIATIFRSISLYGSTLSKATWDATLWEVVFPLVEAVSTSIQNHNRDSSSSPDDGEDLVSQSNGPPIRLVDKQWDDSKTLALKSTGNVFFEYLPKIVKTARYEETWAAFIGHIKRSFIEDRPQVATAAMQALEKVLSVSLDGGEASRIASSWEVAWAAWDEIGHSIVALSNSQTPGGKTYTQVNLEAYVRVALPIYTPPYITFDLSRIHRLLAILKAVLTFARSPDYRPDIDSLTPLQAAILEVVAVIKLEVPGAASAVLSDLSEYLTLAFVAAFDSEPESVAPNRPRARSQRISYIALSKEAMPHVLWLFQRYKDDSSIYEQGAVERMLAVRDVSAFIVDSTLTLLSFALCRRTLFRSSSSTTARHPPSSARPNCCGRRRQSTSSRRSRIALRVFRRWDRVSSRGWFLCLTDNELKVSRAGLPAASFEGIWRQIVEGFKGALLADTYVDFSRLASKPLSWRPLQGSQRGAYDGGTPRRGEL
jgi:hypothetical protein